MHRFNGGYKIGYTGLEHFSDEDKAALFLLSNKAAARFGRALGDDTEISVAVRPVGLAWGVHVHARNKNSEQAAVFTYDTDARRALYTALGDMEEALINRAAVA